MLRLLVAAVALSATAVRAEDLFKSMVASEACGIDDCEGVRRSAF